MATHVTGEMAEPMAVKKRMPKKELEHMRIMKAENGGHVVEHHFTHFDHKPESHVFGAHEGSKMLDHVAHHMGIQDEEQEFENEKN